MSDDQRICGLILVLLNDGTIDTVIRDDLSLFDNAPDKLPFIDIIDPSQVNSFFRVFEQISHKGVVHDWKIHVKGRYWSGLLHATAVVQNNRIWIAGSPVREWLNQIFEEAVSLSRQSSDTSPEGLSQIRMSMDVYEELTRITNELVNAQREIAAKNLQLEREKQEIEEKEKRYRILFEAMEQGVIYLDASGAIFSANPAAERILGLTLDQMQGRTSFHPDWKTIREDGTPFLPEEHPSTISLKRGIPVKGVLMGVLHPLEKAYRWIQIDATPYFKDGENTPYQVHTVFTDVTRQKNLETTLKEKTEYLEKLIQYANAPIIVWNSDLIITEFNRAFEELTGIPAKEAKGQKIDILFPEKTRDDSMRLIQNALSGETWETVEIPIRGKGGEVRTVLWNSANVKVRIGDKYLTTTIAQGQDITRRKQAENSLRQLNRQLNLMTSITRHDILNKVNVIQILCRLIRDNPDQSNIMDHIDNIELATNMIEEQIEFTRLYQELGSQEPAWQRIIPIIESLYTPEKFNFIITLDDVSIYADLLLEKVFYNLLDNSLRHGQTVNKIEVFSEITEDGLKIIWQDNGIGIPEDEKEKIFERGYGKNTGLGMFFIRDILSLTGITISETGTFGEGARFEIFVPECNFKIHSDRDTTGNHDKLQKQECLPASDTLSSPSGIIHGNSCTILLKEDSQRQNVLINEHIYRELFEYAGEAIFIIDIEEPEAGRIIDCNYEAARMNGYTIAELRQMNIFDLDPWKTAEIREMVLHTRQGEWFSCEVNHKRKDGTIYPLEIRVGKVQIEEKQYVISFERDISGRRAIEKLQQNIQQELKEELTLSESRYKTLYDLSGDSIFIVDMSGYVLDANETACSRLGYTKNELVGMHVSMIDNPINALQVPDRMEGIINQGSVLFETEHLTKNGQSVPFEVHSRLIEYEGKPAIISAARDITKRKEALRALEESEMRFRQFADEISDIIYFISLNPEKILYVNSAFQRILGIPMEEVADSPRRLIDYIHPDDKERVSSGIEALLEGKIPYLEVEYRALDNERRIKWFHDRFFIIKTENNRPIQLGIISEEITERKLFEERQNADLKEKETLLKEIHHRVRNNMQIISSLLSLQEEKISDPAVKEVLHEHLNRIRSIALVYDHLYQKENLDRIRYREYLKSFSQYLLHSYHIDPDKISVLMNFDELEIDITTAVPLSLILNEMITNSLKYAFPGDKKGIIRIIISEKNNSYLLSYSDNGIGIPETMLITHPKTLGLQMIQGLTAQIKGQLSLITENEFGYRIEFPKPMKKEAS